MSDETRHMWVGIGKQILSGLVGAIFAAFILGGARQRMADVSTWRADAQPRIERMDAQGTNSFIYWKGSYEKEQTQQYQRIQKLEEQTSHLEAMELRIDRLERNHTQPPRNTQP